MWSQVGLRKHLYEQRKWRWWNSSGAISNPERWCCENTALNMPANLENSAEATGLEKVSFRSNPKERKCQKLFKLPHGLLMSQSIKVMLKILQARLQQYRNAELPNVQAGFRKVRGTRDQIANIWWTIEKQESSRKHLFLLYWLWKTLTVWITINWRILKQMDIPDHLTASWETCMQVRKQQLELDMEQQTGSK